MLGLSFGLVEPESVRNAGYRAKQSLEEEEVK